MPCEYLALSLQVDHVLTLRSCHKSLQHTGRQACGHQSASQTRFRLQKVGQQCEGGSGSRSGAEKGREGEGGGKVQVRCPDAAGAGGRAKSGMTGMQPAPSAHDSDGAGDSEAKISSCAACGTARGL